MRRVALHSDDCVCGTVVVAVVVTAVAVAVGGVAVISIVADTLYDKLVSFLQIGKVRFQEQSLVCSRT